MSINVQRDAELSFTINSVSGGLGGYMNHEAGMLRHVSDLLSPEFFSGKTGIPFSEQAGKDIAAWGRLLETVGEKKLDMARAQLGGRVFEKLVAEGHASGPGGGGTLAAASNNPGWDITALDGSKIQCKFSIKPGGEISGHNLQKILRGDYSPNNNIAGISLPEDSYDWMKTHRPDFFREEAPGVLVGKDGTRIFNSELKAETVDRISRETMQRAQDGSFSIAQEVFVNSLKAGAIASAMALIVSGSINLYRYKVGRMRGDDAVDATVGTACKAGLTATGTSLIVGGTLAVLGIPAVGAGLVIAIPLGILAGTGVGTLVNKSLDSVYDRLMGGEQILIARRQVEWVHAACERIDQSYALGKQLDREMPHAQPVSASMFSATDELLRKSDEFLRRRRAL